MGGHNRFANGGGGRGGERRESGGGVGEVYSIHHHFYPKVNVPRSPAPFPRSLAVHPALTTGSARAIGSISLTTSGCDIDDGQSPAHAAQSCCARPGPATSSFPPETGRGRACCSVWTMEDRSRRNSRRTACRAGSKHSNNNNRLLTV